MKNFTHFKITRLVRIPNHILPSCVCISVTIIRDIEVYDSKTFWYFTETHLAPIHWNRCIITKPRKHLKQRAMDFEWFESPDIGQQYNWDTCRIETTQSGKQSISWHLDFGICYDDTSCYWFPLLYIISGHIRTPSLKPANKEIVTYFLTGSPIGGYLYRRTAMQPVFYLDLSTTQTP